MRLVKPSKENIRKLYKKYHESDESLKILYSLILKLIVKYPSHNKLKHVLTKFIVINQLYSTNIKAIKKMAKYISKKKLSYHISSGSPLAVNTITKGHRIISTKKGKEYEFYSFATKYCHSHMPSKFHIYDKNVDFILWEYQKKDGFSEFKRKDLKDYQKFVNILKDFKDHYRLGTL